jgi:hypothetical protein
MPLGDRKAGSLVETARLSKYRTLVYIPRRRSPQTNDCEQDLAVVAAGVDVAGPLLAEWQQRNAVQVIVVGDQGAIAGKKC